MDKDTTKLFATAAEHNINKILDAIRAPEKDFLTTNYVANKSKDVAEGLLHLARIGETEAVTSFIVSDAVRFNTLTKNGQLKTLMETLEQLDRSQQTRILSATESCLYGAPNATVIQNIVSSKDKDVHDKLLGILRGLNTQQRTEILSAKMATWWILCHDQLPLLYAVVESLSQNERQRVIDKSGDIPMVLQNSCSQELSDLFKGCRFPSTQPPILKT